MQHFLIVLFLFVGSLAEAQMPSHPETDPQFLTLPDGISLASVSVEGVPLSLTHGEGHEFGALEGALYNSLKAATKIKADYPVRWLLADLDAHRVVDSSSQPDTVMFGASISKLCVAGALLDKQGSTIRTGQLQDLADMLVISSNTAWLALQKELGDGDDDAGRAANYRFTQRLGLARTRGYQGSWGTVHGNELLATEFADYLYDLYQGRFPGAEAVWKLMHTTRTGADRGRKYLPTALIVGGKTGTYEGESIDPHTGSPNGPDGKPYRVNVRHHVLVFSVNGREYGLVIFANDGSDESAALLAGGIFHDLTLGAL